MLPTSVRERVEALQSNLVSHATDGTADPAEYLELRRTLLEDPIVGLLLPGFVRKCRSLDQFWEFIKRKFGTYAARREFIWEEFQPVLDYLEGVGQSPSDRAVAATLESFDRDGVLAVWRKAVDRRSNDPEGAITAARSLLETVCKHILDDAGIEYERDCDLPKLYRLTAKQLKLAPSQHTEAIFRQILGGCQSVVEGLASARNRLSDSHGQGKRPVRPAPRHAELAVNLAGSMAVFLIATWTATRPAAD